MSDPASFLRPLDLAHGDPVIAAADGFLSASAEPCRLLVALSGGSDSMGLLRALHAALPAHPHIAIEACTVDHALRDESAEEARRMGDLCARLGIRHHIRRWNEAKPSSGLQAAARLARYRLLAELAEANGIDAVVSGHTADDQAETVAMRRLRSIPDQPGLAGMAPATLLFGRVWLLRPFLSLRRGEIRQFLQAIGQDFIEDPSNDNPRFERVRLRQIRAGAEREAHAAEMAAIAKASAARLAQDCAVAALLDAHARRVGAGIVRLSPDLLMNADLPAVRRACGLLAAAMGGRVAMPGRETMGRLMDFLARQAPGRMTAAGAVFDRRYQGLYLYREARDLPSLTLPPGTTMLWDGRVSVTSHSERPLMLSAMSQGRIDADEDVPSGVVGRAARAHLRVLAQTGALADAAEWHAEPCLRLYDTFLPCFDRMIAGKVACLVGRKPFPALPAVASVLLSGRPEAV